MAQKTFILVGTIGLFVSLGASADGPVRAGDASGSAENPADGLRAWRTAPKRPKLTPDEQARMRP
jgi:hypothetical protein